MTDTFLTVEQAADILGVHPASVYRWVAENRLRAFKPSRQTIRIRQSDLDTFIDGNMTDDTAASSASVPASFPLVNDANLTSILQRQRPGRKAKRA